MEQKMTDQDLSTEALDLQIFLASGYTGYTFECSNTNLRSDMSRIMEDEIQIGYEIYKIMNEKGWYPQKMANQSEIDSAKMKYNA